MDLEKLTEIVGERASYSQGDLTSPRSPRRDPAVILISWTAEAGYSSWLSNMTVWVGPTPVPSFRQGFRVQNTLFRIG
jgi:hypothetical protein